MRGRTKITGSILTLAVVLTTASSLFADDLATPAATTPAAAPNPPTSYNAISDTKYYPKPELPKLGPAGTIIIDPTFGCPILRLTDENTLKGFSMVTPASAEQNTWNTDSTIFFVHSSGMAAVTYRFDPKTMKATVIPDAPTGLDCFSHHDPNIAWGKDGKRGIVYTYNFATKQTTNILDVAKESGLPVSRTGAFHVSANDTISIIFGGKQQDKDMYMFVYNTKDKSHHLWNTLEATLDGKPLAESTPKFTMHNGTIDETGRYVCAGGPGSGSPCILDLQTANAYSLTVENTGHRVMGFGTMINDVHRWVIRTLDPAGFAKPTDLCEHPKDEAYFHYDSHPSWNNVRPDIKVPFATSTYHGGEVDDPKCAWGDEVIACATDGSKKVWRFCHTRTHVGTIGTPDYNFWDTPRGNISQDGRFFMFTSNWEDTLGKDKAGRPRDDVFIVKFERAEKPNP